MKIYFHHIGKTAGTAFRQYLIEQLGEAKVSPMLRGVKFRDALRDYAHFAAIGGHIGVTPGDKLPSNRVSFTLLRDPIERALSEFSFRRNVHLLGRQRNPLIFADLESWLDALSDHEHDALNAQLDAIWAFGWDAPSLPGMQQMVIAAKRGLETFDVIGLQDRFDESVAKFAYRMGWGLSSRLPRENVTPGRITRGDLSDSAMGRLRRYLEADYEVYQYGLKLFERRQLVVQQIANHKSAVSANMGDARGQLAFAAGMHDTEHFAKKRLSEPSGDECPAAQEEVANMTNDDEMSVVGVEVRGVISGSSLLQVGETASIDVQFCAHVAEQQLTVGFSIHDHNEVLVFGTNTRLLGDNLDVVPGEYAVSFSFRNDLGFGKYWVTVTLHRGMSELERSFQHLEHAAEFEVTDMVTEYFEGRVRLNVDSLVSAVSPTAQLKLTPSTGDEREGFWILGRRNPALTDFSAQISPQVKIETMRGAADMLVSMTLTNSGSEVWPAFGRRSVHVSYHWLDMLGAVIEADGLRTTLPRDIAPGKTFRLNCFLRAPEGAGEFKLVWTLVQEEVAWFDERNASSRFDSVVTVA